MLKKKFIHTHATLDFSLGNILKVPSFTLNIFVDATFCDYFCLRPHY